MEIDEQVLAAKFEAVLPHLGERQRRLVLGAEARWLGHGGIELVARASGVSRKTVSAGVAELEAGEDPLAGRVRREGGGRKRLTETDPGLLEALDGLVEPATRGDPMTRLRWTTRSTRNLAGELRSQGHRVSHHSVARLLAAELGYSLQGNAKTLEGAQHPGPSPRVQTRTHGTVSQFHQVSDWSTSGSHATGVAPAVLSRDGERQSSSDNKHDTMEACCESSPSCAQHSVMPQAWEPLENDRDSQFRYINDQVSVAIAAGEPVISVDAKKKELIGPYASKGRTWRPRGKPEQVNTHDFIDKKLGKAVPYGVYDIGANAGWVAVGSDGDTAAFAVMTIRRWWHSVGDQAYPDAKKLLITADAGGSNGYRLRLWKVELARLADELGIAITVAHMPPGTSKWNQIEHRLFSHISMNRAGQPLTSHEVAVNLIAGTTTHTGLTVHAERDTATYPRGTRITNREMGELEQTHITRHDWHGEWNYTLHPAA